MKKNFTKVISVFVALLMLLAAIPFAVSGADVECYVDGVASTMSIYKTIQNAMPGQTITIAEGFKNWAPYIEPDNLQNESDVLTIDLNGQTITDCIDVWPNVDVYGTVIIKNGTVIAPEGGSAIHVSDNIKMVELYDVEVYGQLDSNRFTKTKVNALSVYSGNFHDGNFDPYYSSVKPNYITVYGGNWEYDVSAFVGKGTEIIEHIDGTYSVEKLGDIDFATDANGNYLISNVNDLQNLRRAVDAGTSYKGKTFVLTSDIDLAGIKWNPIGSASAAFQGTFDGNGHKISNVYVNSVSDEIGLFSTVKNAVIKDLTIENATVIGSSKNKGAGALTGSAGTNTTISNVTVCGKILIETGYYVGGIDGDYSYAKYNNCTVDGSNPENFESTIHSTRHTDSADTGYTNYVGGICGLYGEGSKGIDKCTVKNITLIAEDYGVGGITGVLQSDSTITNCTVSDVIIRSPKADDTFGWTGYIVGKNFTKSSAPMSQIINCTANYKAYIHDSAEPTEVFPIGTDYSTTDGLNDIYACNTIVGENVTYDENGKITGGDFILLGEKTKDEFENLVADDVEFNFDENGNVSVKPAQCQHTEIDYTYNNDATCTSDGTKTGVCHKCGEVIGTITAEGTKLPHNDADGDKICDDCNARLSGYRWCKWCPRYERYKNNPVFGWLINFIHIIVHTFTSIPISDV